jgi:hypothetical protein
MMGRDDEAMMGKARRFWCGKSVAMRRRREIGACL